MEPMKIGVAGVSGRMGREIAMAASSRNDMALSAASEHPGHPWIGNPLVDCLQECGSSCQVDGDPSTAFRAVDAIIDFTTPENSVANAAVAAHRQIVHVIGTTGMDDDQRSAIADASRSSVIVCSGNMSLGINLLTGLTEIVARALDDEFDIEIVETHHRHKVDAPSGTALMLGRAADKGRGSDGSGSTTLCHVGTPGPRKKGSIGYSAIRGGDVVGEHDVILAANGERIILRHVATDRSIYARGALTAALWARGKPFGQYDMKDVLGL